MDTPSRTDRPYLIWGIIILAASLIVRLIVYPVISGDYIASISHWMSALHSPGLSAFKTQFSDYAPLYLYFLKILTLIPIYELFTIKTLSVAFDIILGLVTVAILKKDPRRAWTNSKLFFAFACIFAIPTVILNSSAWAQADSLYTAFILLSLYSVIRDKPLVASVFFGIAFSLKLQAVFFLPILIGYLALRKKNLYDLFAIPIIYIITVIPAWLAGGSLWSLLGVYGQQTSEFQDLTLSAPTLFSFVSESVSSSSLAAVLSGLGMLLALIAAAWIAWTIIRVGKVRPFKLEEIVLMSLLSAAILPFFLPHMHERYFYLADVLSVLYAFLAPKRWYLPVLIVGASFFSYIPFLSGSIPFLGYWKINESILGIVELTALVVLVVITRKNTAHVES